MYWSPRFCLPLNSVSLLVLTLRPFYRCGSGPGRSQVPDTEQARNSTLKAFVSKIPAPVRSCAHCTLGATKPQAWVKIPHAFLRWPGAVAAASTSLELSFPVQFRLIGIIRMEV